jgi:excisionase family DNA binding protein
MQEHEPVYLLIPEAAEVARVSVATIGRWIQRDELRSYKAGRRRLVKRDELKKFIEEGQR